MHVFNNVADTAQGRVPGPLCFVHRLFDHTLADRFQPAKADLLKLDLNSLSTPGKVRSFLGFCSFHKAVIPNYLTLVKPFLAYVGKEADMSSLFRSKSAQSAFKMLTRHLEAQLASGSLQQCAVASAQRWKPR